MIMPVMMVMVMVVIMTAMTMTMTMAMMLMMMTMVVMMMMAIMMVMMLRRRMRRWSMRKRKVAPPPPPLAMWILSFASQRERTEAQIIHGYCARAPFPVTVDLGARMAYSSWKKQGEVVSPCRVVGLAVEALCEKEAENDISMLAVDSCSSVELWGAQALDGRGGWSRAGTCTVPVQRHHQSLAMYVVKKLYAWVAGLGLCVAAAVQPKSRPEGKGHHDLVLKHGGHLVAGPFLCRGFLSAELKVRQVGVDGRGFRRAWDGAKENTEEALSMVLRAPNSKFGAAVLFVVGMVWPSV